MIHLRRLDGTDFVLNADLIATLEHTPDTAVTLTNGIRILVHESVDEVVERVIAYRQRLLRGPFAGEEK